MITFHEIFLGTVLAACLSSVYLASTSAGILFFLPAAALLACVAVLYRQWYIIPA